MSGVGKRTSGAAPSAAAAAAASKRSSQTSGAATATATGSSSARKGAAGKQQPTVPEVAVAPEEPKEEQFYFEEVDVPSDSDDPSAYTEVPVEGGAGADDDADSPADGAEADDDAAAGGGDDYAALVTSLRNTHTTLPAIGKAQGASPSAAAHKRSVGASGSSSDLSASSNSTPADVWLQRKLKVWKMPKTAEMFAAEWADLRDAGAQPTPAQIGVVPHERVAARAEAGDAKIGALERELNATGAVAHAARESWEKLKRERDYHRMHHQRVLQEKEALVRDLKRLKAHYHTFEPALAAMQAKYEAATKDKMMMRLERDRCKGRADALEAHIKVLEAGASETKESEGPASSSASKKEGTGEKKVRSKNGSHPKDSPLPAPEMNPSLVAAAAAAIAAQPGVILDAQSVSRFQLRKTFKGHRAAISGMALHPTRPLLATVSDDQTWKLWSLPKGELLMSGEGHKDWMSACAFHPRGSLLATASGDATVKLWDVGGAKCSATFTEHSQAVWDVAFHAGGDLFASGSMDHTAKVWDMQSQRCRQTFRGHVDSVNSVAWQPHGSGVLVTASGDKTVSLWDARSGLCVQTLYGHANAVSTAAFSAQGDAIVSADADGVVKLWDVRLVGERAHVRSTAGQAVNDAQFDRSGALIALAADDHSVKVISTADARHVTDLLGHEDAVQAVLFDPQGHFIVSAAADHTFRIWS